MIGTDNVANILFSVLLFATDGILVIPDSGSSGMKLEIMIYASFKS